MSMDLVDAVNALIRPSRSKVIQGDRVSTVTHDPLLVQLEAAVTSAITGNGGGAGEPSGVLVNSEALYRLSIIRTQIGDWCRIQSVPVSRDAVTDLMRWHVAFLSSNADEGFYVHALQGWARTIVELLNPPKRIPLVDPCVACGAERFETADGSLNPNPVVIEYDQTELHASLRAVCRVCEVVWHGPDAVEELVSEMKEKHPETTRIIDE